MPGYAVLQGDCRDLLKEMGRNEVHAMPTDPPYELGFMNRGWDRSGIAYDPEVWSEAYRVLKPGAHMAVFGGTRTFHRVACAIEDEGFEIRDTLCWLYGKGFPKSLDISKALDKRAGAERIKLGRNPNSRENSTKEDTLFETGLVGKTGYLTKAATKEALAWEGWGTALKPGWEPVILARKPLDGTVAENVLEHGVGGLNIDGTRLGYQSTADKAGAKPAGKATSKVGALAGGTQNDADRTGFEAKTIGRWPPNVILQHDEGCVQLDGTVKVKSDGHRPKNTGNATMWAGKGGGLNGREQEEVYLGGEDGTEEVERWACVPECPIRMLDSQAGMRKAGGQPKRRKADKFRSTFGEFKGQQETWPGQGPSVGSASRFFYCTKASRKERDAGLDHLDLQVYGQSNGALARQARGEEADNWDGAREIGLNRLKEVRNPHPTVKPIAVMRWLTKMITPPGGTALDPFTGSGSTGVAAVLEGFDFLGFELDPFYAKMAEKRIEHWANGGTA